MLTVKERQPSAMLVAMTAAMKETVALRCPRVYKEGNEDPLNDLFNKVYNTRDQLLL
jgi:hypothetical protein